MKAIRFSLAVILLCSSSVTVAKTFYKCSNDKGKVEYSNAPIAGAHCKTLDNAVVAAPYRRITPKVGMTKEHLTGAIGDPLNIASKTNSQGHFEVWEYPNKHFYSFRGDTLVEINTGL